MARLNKVYVICQQDHEEEDEKGEEKIRRCNKHCEKGVGEATILHNYGAGSKMEQSLFELMIEPKKEDILILVSTEKTQ